MVNLEKDINYIKENIDFIMKEIEIAANKSGRSSSDITLLAVTKTVSIDKIKVAMDYGIKNLGENKVQELVCKYDELGNECNWHLIGHLQTNKVKYLIDKVKLIHSVDSKKLAIEIDDKAQKNGIIMDILIEVNISGENSKFGIKPDEIDYLLEEISILKNLRLKGLMTIAPFVDNPEENRTYFKNMYKLFIDISKKKNDNIDMKYLSMGMTNDYKIAIEEGANIVRIGTGIFGNRYYR